MIRIRDIKLPAASGEAELFDKIINIMCLDMIYPGNSFPDFSFEILRKSIDARKKPDIYFVYTVRLLIGDEDEKHILSYLSKSRKNKRVKKALEKIVTDPLPEYLIPECGNKPLKRPPVIVGSGPAGLFAALILARRGFCPIVIERGEKVEDRIKTVSKFWDTGKLSPESNVQFGEGGAGTFSDGKLTTLTKDESGRNSFVIRTFYEHGANKDITIDAKPHIGTDVLTKVVEGIRNEIISLGGQFFYNTKLVDIESDRDGIKALKTADTLTGKESSIETSLCILAIGHSARDTFEMLCRHNIKMSQKSFAVGFRLVHPQKLVNRWAYGDAADEAHLPPADYKVTNETLKNKRVYSFCMCPGGYVVNASSEDGRMCVNGMSEWRRDSGYANSAIICAIDPDDFDQDVVAADHPLAGMYYQRSIEEKAFMRGGGSIPCQTFSSFESGNTMDELPDHIEEAVKGKAAPASLRGIFSEDIDEAIIESVHKFGYTRESFDSEAVMLGVEERTSSPVRINRNEELMSDIRGLYPCGEGAGYAGGIVSAATDGIKVAEKIIQTYHMEKNSG